MNRFFFLVLGIILLLTLDLYVYQGIRTISAGYKLPIRLAIQVVYWTLTGITVGVVLVSGVIKFGFQGRIFKYLFTPFSFIQYISKLFFALFLLVDDIIRLAKWSFGKWVVRQNTDLLLNTGLTRSEFLVQAGAIVAALPLFTLSYGIMSGAHDYRIRRVKVKLPNLPSNFHGLKIGQLSDIHSGSFFSKSAVKRGVAMFMAEKPDIIFFTGDLVNDQAEEVKEYIDIFSQIKAPLGVYSTLGNHDYGDYMTWPSLEAKRQNLLDVCKAHELLGWRLLMNEHKIIERGGDQLAIIGIENWGMGRFTKYGRLARAYQGTKDIPVKLLLSHDPSHWDAEVRPFFSDIDLTFAGHTHGFQFGIELGSFKWSPVQYVYKQWAGLYRTDSQYLYVNRGFGYIGYPGRIGILPELTILELEKA
jgi:predicted MPP superfamily phosphohydrolase